jgi:hypothetical protein
LATAPTNAFANVVQCSLVTMTNVYIYSSKTGAPVSGRNGGVFYNDSYTDLYITEGPYSSPGNTDYMDLYVAAYGGVATNFWGQLIPGQAYQLTGVLAIYKGYVEFDVTRFQDFVTNPPAPFAVGLVCSNTVSTISWPAASGSTYSVYSATNLLGPWTQTFGLSYCPSTGIYTTTNAATTQFYKVSSP